MGFDNMGISPWLVDSLSAMAIKNPTPIQAACIPEILQGKNCIGGSRTGSGKTVAFIVPILEQWAQDPFGVYALILAPTRELAIQLAEQFKALGAPQNLKLCLLIGGVDMRQQALNLSARPHVVVATPGRLADHIRCSGQDTIAGLKKVKVVVMDEADRLLSGNYASDLLECLAVVRDGTQNASKQTLLFSATITEEVNTLKKSYQDASLSGGRGLFVCETNMEELTIPPQLDQTYLLKPSQAHLAFLHALLSTPLNFKKSVIVFANRTWTAALLSHTLKLLGHRVTPLHSSLSQTERINSLGRFRASAARILIATDVASRGLDIPEVEMVINFDIPRDPNDYIHRIGRTARAGRRGEAVTFVKERDLLVIQAIEQRTGSTIKEYVEEKGVSLEGRVIREYLKKVSEAKRAATIALEEEAVNVKSRSYKKEHESSKSLKRKKIDD